jgi:hypothetical protein
MTKLNEHGSVGATFVLILGIVVIGMGWLLFTPIFDAVNDAQATQITNGEPVSPERISTMNTLTTFWEEALLVVLLIMMGIWYWVVSIRERSGSI